MPRVKQFDRKEVLHKAMTLFWEKGYHATSINDLVEHLGINRGSMYSVFEGKDQMFLEALQLYLQENSGQFPSIDKALETRNVKDFMRDFLLADFDPDQEEQASKGCFTVNTATEMAAKSEAVCAFLQSNCTQVTNFFTQLFRIGQQRGEVPVELDPSAMAYQLFAFINGLKVIGKYEEDRMKLKQAVEVQLGYLFG